MQTSRTAFGKVLKDIQNDLTDSFVAEGGQLVVRELIGPRGELCEDATVWVLLWAACELSQSLLSEGHSLPGAVKLVLLSEHCVSSEESFHSIINYQSDSTSLSYYHICTDLRHSYQLIYDL